MPAGYVFENWVSVLVNPVELFEWVNQEERGQSSALAFFISVALISKVPEYVVYQLSSSSVSINTDPVNVFLFAVLVLLFSPVFLHIVTAFQYLLLWFVTDEDEGVDNTLRALAYGSAPALLAWVPVIGVIAALYSLYLISIGIRVGHRISRLRAFIISLFPWLLLVGVGFSGFQSLTRTSHLLGFV